MKMGNKLIWNVVISVLITVGIRMLFSVALSPLGLILLINLATVQLLIGWSIFEYKKFRTIHSLIKGLICIFFCSMIGCIVPLIILLAQSEIKKTNQGINVLSLNGIIIWLIVILSIFVYSISTLLIKFLGNKQASS